MAWTDERLDDLASRVDAGFAQVSVDIRELRHEVKGDISELRTELKDDITESRTELKGDIARLDAKVDRQQLLLIQLFVGFFFALIGADAVGLIGS